VECEAGDLLEVRIEGVHLTVVLERKGGDDGV
jgi:hypothetical protein